MAEQDNILKLELESFEPVEIELRIFQVLMAYLPSLHPCFQSRQHRRLMNSNLRTDPMNLTKNSAGISFIGPELRCLGLPAN